MESLRSLKPEWPRVNTEKCNDERPLRKCQPVANSPSLTGSEQIPPGFIPAASVKMGSGEVERRENAIAQQKSVLTPAVSVYSPTMSPSGLPGSSKRKRSARKINRGERLVVP